MGCQDLHQGLRQLGAGEPHVTADNHPAHTKLIGKGQTDPADDITVKLVGEPTTDVIGGKTAKGSSHGETSVAIRWVLMY